MLAYSHDIAQIILLNIYYIFSLYSCHLIYRQVGIISQVAKVDEEFISFSSKDDVFSPQFQKLCRHLKIMQKQVDECISWFLLIVIPSSIIIPMIQLYKVHYNND